MSNRSSILRTLSLTPDGTLPADKVPPSLAVVAPRRGGPIVLEWRVEFIDATGAACVGGTTGDPDVGSATVQWHSIKFRDPELAAAVASGPLAARALPDVKTQVLGAAVVAAGSALKELSVPADTWPWPRVTAVTAPDVLPKTIRALITGGEDGIYSVTINDGDEHAHEASGETAAEIRTALLALIDDAGVDVAADPDNTAAILITGTEVGVDFTVDVASTGSEITTATTQGLRQPPAGINIHAIIDRAGA
jgi:hypothetical protein